MTRLFIGTAGWCIPRASAHRFDHEGSHLQRHARMLRCAEINSSFHRPHAEATDAKWAASTPADFRVAVKLPRIITHDQKLQRARHAGAVVCEPRHESWFSAAADALLVHYEVGRVAVDPPPAAGAARPGG